MRPVVLLSLLALPPATAGAREVGVAPATRKVLPDDPVPAARAAALQAARNEWEAFQVVVRDAEGVPGLDLTLSDLRGPGGAIIPAGAARRYREWTVEVVDPSPLGLPLHERRAGRYPDPLIPFLDPWAEEAVPVGAPFDLPPDETGVVLVDLRVPDNAPAGAYSGSVTVSAADGWTAELPVALTVWDFEIPAERSVGTAFGFSPGNVRPYHGGAGDEPSDELPAIVERYVAALHEHRIDPTTVSGPVEVEFDAEGRLLPVDWSAYDAAVGPSLDGSRFPDGVGVTRFNVSHFAPGRGTGDWTEDQYRQAAAAFAEHLVERGWWERAYVYALDEPWLHDADRDYARIARDADLLLAASDLWRDKVLVTSPYDERVAGRVGIWCPVTPMYEDWFYVWDPMPGWDTYTERLAAGEELWFYVCNANTPPYAGYDIDTALGYEPRIVKWGAWFERATGFLYWRVSFWVDDDPWNVLSDVPRFGELFARAGDGSLLYPGDHDGTAGGKGSPEGIRLDGPIVSYRLKQIRDGLEDWELFRLASDLGAEEFVRAQVRRAYQRFGDMFGEDCDQPGMYCPDDQPWTLDEAVLLDARAQVARKVQALLHPERWPDPEAEPEPDAGGQADAGAAPDADPGAPATASTGGCGCQTSPAGLRSLPLVLPALLRRGRPGGARQIGRCAHGPSEGTEPGDGH